MRSKVLAAALSRRKRDQTSSGTTFEAAARLAGAGPLTLSPRPLRVQEDPFARMARPHDPVALGLAFLGDGAI